MDTAARGITRLCELPRAIATVLVLAACAVSLVACHPVDGDAARTLNGSIHVVAGQPAESVATLNGAIEIDADAVVTTAATVNGSIRAGAHVKAQSFTTVNGSIDLGQGDQVTHWVTAINGAITLADGSDVMGSVTNVTGAINLTNARVGGGLKTSNGNINVLGHSEIQGGILVEAATVSGGNGGNTPRIVIGPNADVEGELRFERPVQLYVSDEAKIGAVTGTTPIRFPGAVPPGGPQLSDASAAPGSVRAAAGAAP